MRPIYSLAWVSLTDSKVLLVDARMSVPQQKARSRRPHLALCLLAIVLVGFFADRDSNASDVRWEGGVTVVYQDSDDKRTESELTASADLFATLPTDRGEWLLYVEASSSPKANGVSAFYPTANGDASSVLTIDGKGGLQISEFNYTFHLKGDRSLMLGLIDPSAWLDRGRIANDENKHFLNGSFVNNATIEFPDYTLGGVFRVLGKDRRPELTLVASGSDGIADVPDRSYQDLLDLNADGRGIFFGAGASWLFDRSSWRVGAWLRNDDHEVAGNAGDTEMNYGAYGVYGWQSELNALNLRAGIANSDVSVVDGFLAVAYQRKTRFGLLGIGIAHSNISRAFRVTDRDSALDSEVYFRIPILDDSGHITPSIQYVEVPGLDTAGSVPTATATVVGVRFHWSF